MCGSGERLTVDRASVVEVPKIVDLDERRAGLVEPVWAVVRRDGARAPVARRSRNLLQRPR